MGSIKRVKMDIKGIQEIRKSEGAQGIIEMYAANIAARAGADFMGDTMVGKTRIQGKVQTTSKPAYYRALHNHTLSKVLKG